MNILLLVVVLVVLNKCYNPTGISEALHRKFPVLHHVTRIVTGVSDATGALLDKSFTAVTPVAAWAWVVCLVLSVVEWVTPLEFGDWHVRTAAHGGLWLLLFFAARQFRWSYVVPTWLWVSTIVVGAVSTVLLFVGLPLIFFLASFFLPLTPWRTTYVYFRQGNAVVADQYRENIGGAKSYRRVLLRPVTPLFNKVELLEYQNEQAPSRPAGEGWVTMNKKAEDFSLDPVKQRNLDAAKAIERQCWANRRRIDSLALMGRLPYQARTLPAPTRHGANTVGCLVDKEVWCNYLILPGPGECKQAGAVGAVRETLPNQRYPSFSLSAIMRVGKTYRSIWLKIPELRGPGVYRLSNDAYATNSPTAANLMLSVHNTEGYTTTKDDYVTTAQYPATLTITRFDTVARVVSGTFNGQVYNLSSHTGPLLVESGRFDVKYYTGSLLD